MTWKDFRVEGQLIFCEICKRIRFAEFIAADVTTLNFNLLFEIGFAVGLGVPVAPIRDTTIITNKSEFDELGMLDTIGYVDFQNSKQLYCAISTNQPFAPLPVQIENVNYDAPVYVVRMLQEEHFPQPIDYRDIVYSYSHPSQVDAPITKLILHAIKSLQSAKQRNVAPPKKLLERLDLEPVQKLIPIFGRQDGVVPTG
jgi:hypothetical protein